MRYFNKFIIFSAVAFSVFIFGEDALAAKFYMTPQSGTHVLKSTISVDVKVDSQGEGINAAQAQITFPKDVLEVKSIDRTGSVFNFWPEEPSFLNENGTINFIGGTVNGISGATLQILKITFNAKAVGDATLSFTDAAITVDDGTGANILSEVSGANYRVSATAIAPVAPAPGEVAPEVKPMLPAPGEPIPPPVLIERVPTPALKLPGMPNVNVSFYPDSGKWYNIISPFNITWPLPSDITDVATAVNMNPNFNPSKSENLFDSKIFDVLPEGISYLHVRFRNSLGWGATAHYRLAIDTTPPLSFIIESPDGFRTDNPAPVLQFETSDSLSGISHYLIKIGDAEAFEWKNGSVKTPLQSPGTHKVLIRAFDLAGNSVSGSVDLETLPIESPVITFFTEKIYFGAEEGVVVKGTALPDMDIRLFLDKSIGGLVSEKVVRSDKDGNWTAVFDKPLAVGAYIVSAQTQDSRGALSLVVKAARVITVKSQPIIKLGRIEIGAGGSATILLIILISAFAGGYWFFRTRQHELAIKVEMTARDYASVYKLINDDLEKLIRDFDKMNATEQKYILDRLKTNAQKIEKYLLEEIRKIKE